LLLSTSSDKSSPDFPTVIKQVEFGAMNAELLVAGESGDQTGMRSVTLHASNVLEMMRTRSLMTGSSACGSGLAFFKQTQPNPRLAQRAGHSIMTTTQQRPGTG